MKNKTERPRIFEFCGCVFRLIFDRFFSILASFSGRGGTPGHPWHPRGGQRRFFMDFGWISGRLWGGSGAPWGSLFGTGALPGRPGRQKSRKKGHPTQQQRSRCDFDAYREGSGPVKCKKNLVKTDVFARDHSRQRVRKKSPFRVQKVSFWALFGHPWATLGRLWPTFCALRCLQGPSRFRNDF